MFFQLWVRGLAEAARTPAQHATESGESNPCRNRLLTAERSAPVLGRSDLGRSTNVGMIQRAQSSTIAAPENGRTPSESPPAVTKLRFNSKPAPWLILDSRGRNPRV